MAAPPPEAPWRIRWSPETGALAGAIGAGVVLRVLHFLRRPSLALDEARLADNIAARTFAQLKAPLDYDQSAPLLFLWAERAITRLFGVNELALRVLPLLAGIGVLFFAYPLLRRFLSERTAVLGVAILAAAPGLVSYSNEVKQYMLEALVALILVRLALSFLENPEKGAGLGLGLAGAIAVWLSASAVLVLAGIGPLLVLSQRHRRTEVGRIALLVALCWAVSFGLAYLAVYRPASLNPYLARYWAPVILSPGADVLERSWAAVKEVVWGFMVGNSGLPRREEADWYLSASSMIGLACLATGLWHVWQTRRVVAGIALVGPIVITAFASILGLYPVWQRLVLFLVPLVLTLGLVGLEAVVDRFGQRRGALAWWATSGLVVLPLLAVATLQATVLDTDSDMRSMVQELRPRRAGEPVYVFSRSLPAWEFYTTDWSEPDPVRLAFLHGAGRSRGPGFENAPSRGRRVTDDEGQDLSYPSAMGLELLGIPTGMEFLAGRGLLRTEPDPGWVEREAERIRNAAAPGTWLVMTEFFGPEYGLFQELTRLGGRMTFGRFEPGHILARYEFNRP